MQRNDFTTRMHYAPDELLATSRHSSPLAPHHLPGELLVTGLALPEGTSLVTVRAVNFAKEASHLALNVSVDTGRPQCSEVLLWQQPHGQLVYTESERTVGQKGWRPLAATTLPPPPLSPVLRLSTRLLPTTSSDMYMGHGAWTWTWTWTWICTQTCT